ncbi:MAG: hypothetical protein HCAMLNBO_02383 [Candidatus Brocadia fulgida]|nr:hypothetical protein [Candidatus Brocadia fulgida]
MNGHNPVRVLNPDGADLLFRLVRVAKLKGKIMNWQKTVPAVLVVCILFSGCTILHKETRDTSALLSHAVTRDIQAGIETHIEEQSRLGGGHFILSFRGKELKLKLVRVHTEYLATLEPGVHFACVDLACADGTVYDVDFFLSGDPGEMIVTETTVHKVNGKPLYVWKQRSDKTWHRVALDKATPELLGVITGRDEFEFVYRAFLPEINDSAALWLPLPSSDGFQTISVKAIDVPARYKILLEPEYGNRVLFMKLGPEHSGQAVTMRFQVQRLEKGVYDAGTFDEKKYLQPESLMPDEQMFRDLADSIVDGKTGDLVRARALYDYVIDNVRYARFGSGWGQGDAIYACNARSGNCSDFHAFFIALCRSIGIPARFAIGAAIPSERNEGGIDGYHCWAEFYTEGRWWPVDISEANKCSSLASYFFGHHPANRIELSRGRDLKPDPRPVSGPINFLVYPVLEIGGKPAQAKVVFAFSRNPAGRP